MILNDVRENWALIVAGALIVVVALVIVAHFYRRSARGQLRTNLARLSTARKVLQKAEKDQRRSERRLSQLAERADRTKPRLLQESKDAVADARALHKIAHDQVLVAENHLRRVIHDEFPPRRHDALRARHLPGEKSDQKPFTF